NADTLTAHPLTAARADSVPAGTPTPATPPTDDPDTGSDTTAEPTTKPARVPAGTSQRCGILGAGPLETRTAERLACNGKIALKVTDPGGEILYLGRSQRLASRAQRRALRLRDTTCVFPGCHQTKHLDAHHTTPWSQRGPTDIDGLALLCRRHHAMVHEGGLHLAPTPERTTAYQPRFQVLDTTGHPVQARWPAMLEHLTLHKTPTGKTADQAESQQAAGHHGPDPTRIAPPPAAPASTSPTASTPCCTTSSNSPPDSTVYLLKPAVSPLISWRRPAMYSARIGSAESITAASTAGMFTVNSPW